MAISAIEGLGKRVLDFFTGVGAIVILFVRSLGWLFRPPFRISLFLQQMEFVGAGSFFIVFLTGTFSGLVLALQLIDGFGRFQAETLVGSTIAIALCRELGPVLTGLIVAGRAASAMATELGTMKVTEQIDALETMAVSTTHYLVVPRLVAGIVMIPILTMLFNVLGLLASYYVSVEVMAIDPGSYLRNINKYLTSRDVTVGVLKSVVFGATIALVACHKGLTASGGARGVGTATTDAVVSNFIAIFVLDYVLTVLAFQ